jgi:uncharacterized membrane protein YidH (DUF202 family)
MTEMQDMLARRAEKLLRWYPSEWRARYGEEFAELLISDMSEQPRSLKRQADVAVSGVVARLAYAGLNQSNLEHSERTRRTLLAFACAAAVFVTFGLGMWAQLTIGWQWSAPDTVATSAAMVVMSCAVLMLLSVGAVAVVPLAWTSVRTALRRGRGRGLRLLLLVVASAGIFILGSRHFANGWPGTGGHPWAHQGLVPGGVAAFIWAATLFVTAYWAHPASLLSFPAPELAWMVVSPIALICFGVGSVRLVREMELSPTLLRFEARLAQLGGVIMVMFLIGASLWVVDGGPGPRNLFHVGAIDIGSICVMVASLATAGRALRLIGRSPGSVATR